MDSLTYLSLYSGGGGLDLGFKLAVPNARAVGYVERDAAAIALLVDHMQAKQLDDAPLWSDSATFESERWSGLVDFVIGGFPCQPWSVAGRQQGLDDERWLWPHIREILRTVQPRGAFLENVPGLFRGGLGPILSDLAALGFSAEWITVRATDVGASHRRERVFILAYRNRGPSDVREWEQHQLDRGIHVMADSEAILGRGTSRSELADSYGGLSDVSIETVRARRTTAVDGDGDVGHPGHDARGAGNGEQQDEQQRGQGRRDTETAGTRESSAMGDTGGSRLQGSDDHTKAPRGVQQEPSERRSGLADADDSGDSAPRHGAQREGSTRTEKREDRSQSESGRHGEQLADADGDGQTARVQRRGDDSQGRSEPNGPTEERGAPVGNASSEGSQGHGGEHRLREDSREAQARRGSSRMVDSTSSGRRPQSDSEHEPVGFNWGCRPLLWPPGPTSPDWGGIIERRPDLAPAKSEIRGVADGTSRGLARTDRLRILGNGVVPQQAALAFTILAKRMSE